MKKLLIGILFVLVTVSGFCAGTTTETSEKTVTTKESFESGRGSVLAYAASNYAILDSSNLEGAFTTELYDPQGCWDGAAYTVPAAGNYRISGKVDVTGSAAIGIMRAGITVDTVSQGEQESSGDGKLYMSIPFDFVVRATAGQVIGTYFLIVSTGGGTINGSAKCGSFIYIRRED